MNKMTVKQKVLEILQLAYSARVLGHINIVFAGARIPCRDGWIAQSIFANPKISGSTEGKRRLRDLRVEPAIEAKWIFEKMNKHGRWYYRIRLREPVITKAVQTKIFMAV